MMSLYNLCKSKNTTPNQLSLFTGVSTRTLRQWHHTRPLVLIRLLESSEFNDLKFKIELGLAHGRCTKTDLA